MAILYDQFGREVRVEKRPETREIAVTTVRDRWSNYPSQGLTPQKLAAIFKEADGGDVYRQSELFEEMEEKDTHLFSELQTRKNAVLGLDYDIIPYSESAEDKKISEFCGDVIFNLPDFEEALLDLLDALGKGYSLSESLWEIDGSKAIITGLRWIHAKRAVFYERGAADPQAKSFEAPKVTTAAEPFNGEEMPPFKLVYHRYKARSGYDTRAGVLRVCAWMYLFKNYSLKDWVAFAEVFGMPLRLGKYEPGAGREEKDALITAVRSLGSDAAGIISKNTEIEFVETMKNAGTNNLYETLANFCNKEMSKAILGQTATTEGTPGKLGNEGAQDKVRSDLIKADAEALARTMRFQVLRPLAGYNFGWDKPLPWLKIQYVPPEDLNMLSEVYRNIWSMGQEISAEHVSERFKIPLPQKGEKVLPPPMPTFPMKMEAGGYLQFINRGLHLPAISTDREMQMIAAKFTPEQEAAMESQRQELLGKYFLEVKGSFSALRGDALREINDLLLGSAAMGQDEFAGKILAVLRTYYGASAEDLAPMIERAMEPVFKYYRVTDRTAWGGAEPPVAMSFEPADRATMAAMSRIDTAYLSKFIENQDMQGPVMKFLREQYTEKAEGLFGRGSEEGISAFRGQFGDHLAGLEDWQIRRILDTSVTRMRSYADVRQGVQARVDLRVHVTRGEMACDICRPRHGEIIPAAAMQGRMDTAARNPEAFGTFDGVPPFHPNCVCRLVMAI